MLKVAGFELGLCTLYKIHLPTITIMENRVNKLHYPYCLMFRIIFISFFSDESNEHRYYESYSVIFKRKSP